MVRNLAPLTNKKKHVQCHSFSIAHCLVPIPHSSFSVPHSLFLHSSISLFFLVHSALHILHFRSPRSPLPVVHSPFFVFFSPFSILCSPFPIPHSSVSPFPFSPFSTPFPHSPFSVPRCPFPIPHSPFPIPPFTNIHASPTPPPPPSHGSLGNASVRKEALQEAKHEPPLIASYHARLLPLQVIGNTERLMFISTLVAPSMG